MRQDHRFFKLGRIRELMVLAETFQRTAPPKLFDGGRVFADEFVTVTLQIAQEMAYRVYDEFPQHQQQPDGSFVVQLTIPRGNWVYQYLATFGEHCQVLAPQDIRQEIKETLQNTLKQYL